MAGRQGSASFGADPKNALKGERPEESAVLRAFGGVNLQSPREDIGDNEFAWLEELIPVAPGNLLPVLGPGGALGAVSSESGAPSYTIGFQIGTANWVFAVWANSGNAWVVNLSGVFTATRIATGVFTSGQTQATPWADTGLLVVDPVAGFYDYNVSAASTFTNLTGQLYGIAVSAKSGTQLQASTVPSLRVTDPTGTGGTIGASASAVSVTGTAGGTGYAVGDTVQLSGGTLTTSSAAPITQQNQPTVLLVTAVNASTGAITGFTIQNAGYYQAAPTGTITTTTGGAGTGATVTANWFVGGPYVITPGNNYTAPVVQAFIGGVWVNYAMTINTSGTLLGSSIAAYAGRVWIATGRTVQFTDVNSYKSFGGAGGAFTINDDTLTGNITSVFAANGYLYIFGPTSVDVLSSVSVSSAGITTFNRVNVSPSVGTTQPDSVFSFVRSVAFANPAGFWAMSGATPERISEKIENFTAAVNYGVTVYGCQATINGILCAAFLVNVMDSFSQIPPAAPRVRQLFAVMFRGRWWFTSQLPSMGVPLTAVVSVPVNGASSLYGWAGNQIYPLLSTTNINLWVLKTKLWDGGAPLLDKQAIQAGVGVVLSGIGSPAMTVNADNEFATVRTTIGVSWPIVTWVNQSNTVTRWKNNSNAIVSWQQTPQGYTLLEGVANIGGGKYAGLTATGTPSNTVQLRMLALAFIPGRRW